MNLIKNPKIVLTASLSLLGLLITLFGGVNIAHAGIFCGGQYGSGLSEKSQSVNVRETVLPDKGGRRYTITEIFPSGASSYGVPIGITEEDWLFTAENNMVSDAVGALDDTQKKRLEAQGKNCLSAQFSFQAFFQNISKSMSTWFSGLINWSTGTFFDQDFICADSRSTNCVPLLEIIGGKTDADGGIIGIFSRGIFMPLAVVAFLFVAGWLIYTGLIKKQFRASFGGILWAVFAFFLGILVMTRPMMIARAPQKLNTIISGCLLEAIQGSSCLGSPSSSPKLFTNQACKSDAAVSKVSDRMLLGINGLSCTVTKGLTIDRWAEQQFGYSFDELYTIDAPDGFSEYNNIQGNASDYCVSLKSSKSPQQLAKEENPTFSGDKICNIAAAYMANRTQGEFGTKATMGHIIATAAKDARMWNAFSGNGRDIMGTTTVISTLAAAISFLPVVFYGHAYSLTSTILMAFAPLFILFGIHPGRGKKIFLGWLESVVSAILKYMASGMLILVMILMYSTVLGKVSNGFLVLIFTLILAFTFVSYRKELANLVGATNLGGAKVANKFEEDYNKRANQTKQLATSIVGGQIGGAMAAVGQAAQDGTLQDNPLEAAKTIAAGAWKGSGKALGMELGRGRGIIPNMIRQGRQVGQEMASDRKEYKKQVREEAERQIARQELQSMMGRAQATQQNIQNRADKAAMSKSVDSALEKSTVQGIQRQLLDRKADIQEAKGANAIKAAGDIALKESLEANLIEKIVVEDSESVSNGVNNYLDRENALKENEFSKGIEEIQSLEEFKALSSQQQEEILSSFHANEMIERQRFIDDLRNNFEIVEIRPGEEILSDADLEANVSMKENFSIDFNSRLNEEIERIKTLKPQSTQENESRKPSPQMGMSENQPVKMPPLEEEKDIPIPNNEKRRRNYQENEQPKSHLPKLERKEETHYEEKDEVIKEVETETKLPIQKIFEEDLELQKQRQTKLADTFFESLENKSKDLKNIQKNTEYKETKPSNYLPEITEIKEEKESEIVKTTINTPPSVNRNYQDFYSEDSKEIKNDTENNLKIHPLRKQIGPLPSLKRSQDLPNLDSIDEEE